MNLCEQLNCQLCCSGVVHGRIMVKDADHLIGERKYIFIDRPDKFWAAVEESSEVLVSSNSLKDRLKEYRTTGKSAMKRVNLFDPDDCRHLKKKKKLGCGDYANRSESCRRLRPGSDDCETIRREKGQLG